MVIPKAPVNIDDPENINRFLEQMKQKKYGSAFTPSMLSNISAASAASGDAVEPASPFNQQSSHPGPQHAMMKGNGVSEATASSDKSSLEDDKPHRQVAMLLPHESGSFAKKPVVNQSEADPSIAVSLTLYRSRGVSLSADSDDALARAELQHWMEENCPPSHRLARRTATPQPLLDKIVQSPLLSGLQAPPPTPETGPVSQRDVTNIIHSTFDGLHGSHPPVLTLGDSKYAPRRKTTLGQTISGQQNPHEGEVYTPFDTPNRELSSASRLKRDEDVERMKSQPSPKQGNFATSASTVVGGDEKDSKESPPNNTGSPTHMAASKSLTAHRSDSSLQQNSGQQISEFQVARMGQQSTSTVKLSSPPLSLHSSANLDLTGDDWIPPHLRPPTDEPLVAKSQDGEVARSLVKSPGEAGSPQPLKREEISFMVNVTTKSETNLHNNQTSCSLHSRLHSKKPAPIFTGDIHDPTPAHRAPGSSSIKPDEDNPWQSGQPTSGILTSPFTPTEQVIYTPAGSSTDSQTPPQLRPREGFTDVTPHLSHDKPDVVSALLGKPLKHVEPLISNPFTLTAVTADHGITPEASKVSATVAAVDRSLSAVADVFKPSFMASTKSPMPIQPPHPLSAQGNSFPAFSEPNNAPRSVLESGVITPSSMTFIAVSPATAAAAGITAAMLGPNEGHNPEDIMFFKSWPKSDDERRPGKPFRLSLYKIYKDWRGDSCHGYSVVSAVRITDVLLFQGSLCLISQLYDTLITLSCPPLRLQLSRS